jgi:threonine dehydrogenase-like Zn-dependent dehydrogenase
MTTREQAAAAELTAGHQALVMVADGRVALQPRQMVAAQPGQVVIEVTATGICGSDVHGLKGATGRRSVGQVMGHETAGVVAEVGDGVDPALLGQRVTVNPVSSCGTCEACLEHEEQQCKSGWVLGVNPDIDAAFAERLMVSARNVVPLPAGMPTWHGALVEPLAVGYHAARRGGAGPADRVLIIGGGPIGQAVVVGCQREGVQAILVSDIDIARSAIVRMLGAPLVLPEELDAAVAKYLDGEATLVFDVVGVPATLETALRYSRNGARIVLVGMASPAQNFPSYEVSARERSIIGTFCYRSDEFRSTMQWLADHPDLPHILVDRVTRLRDGVEVFSGLVAGTIRANKILLSPLADLPAQIRKPSPLLNGDDTGLAPSHQPA